MITLDLSISRASVPCSNAENMSSFQTQWLSTTDDSRSVVVVVVVVFVVVVVVVVIVSWASALYSSCLLYTSDAADE